MKNFIDLLQLTAYANETSWKLDDKGAIVMRDGDPVLVDQSGNELTVSRNTVLDLRAEAKNHRQRAEEFATKYKDYEGLDASAARKALETVSKLDAKQLIESGKVDELKNQITQQFSAQLTEKEKALSDLQNKFNGMLIDGVFANSDFVRSSLAVPADIFKDSFSKFFKVEGGEVVAYDKSGNRILSRSKAGEYASAEEALQILVDGHPQKNTILKADLGSGSGSKGGSGARGTGRTMSVKEFSTLTPSKQAEVSAKIRNGEMSPLTD